MNENQKKLGLLSLIAMIIGSTIGSGVFTITGDMAANGAHTGAIVIGWIICGLGIYCLLQCFSGLNGERPDLVSGIFSYAREGFGEYMGFISAYGYWVSALFTNVSYLALLFTTMNTFIPIFGNGSNLISTILGLVIVWIACLVVLRGVKEAAVLNIFTTIAKLIPLFVFIIAVIVVRAFDPAVFMHNFWGADEMPVLAQIKATSSSTVWSFIGVEGAVVLSTRAKNSKDVTRSTFIGFACLFIIYVLVALLSMGVIPHEELATMENPQLAGILSAAVGPWGALLVKIGIILSIIGAMLGWTILTVEAPAAAAQQDIFPKRFGKMNKFGAPSFTLILTTFIISFFIVLGYFSTKAYLLFYNLCVSMIMLPYLFSAMFYFKMGITGKGFEHGKFSVTHAKIFGCLGTIYGLWMIYASGLSYILVTTTLYAPGIYIYYKARKEQGLSTFDHNYEKYLAAGITLLGVLSIVLLVTGKIVL
ncbi:MAG: basic amino acid/polyamine antiporter [Lachnospiraceae bacterium]|nr:basic amino acid/polyamine antiporter [Lachnospiraceae bacterium]